MHVVPLAELTRIGPLDAEDLELEQRLNQRNERVAHEYLDRLRARLSEAGVSVRALVVRGTSVHRLLVGSIEREQANFVVLSAHGSASRVETPYGGVAAHLIRHAKVPLLIVREPPRRAFLRRGEVHAREAAGRLPGQATP